jgi:hypothetical protein
MKIFGTRSFTRAALATASLVVVIAAAAFGVRLAQGQGASARMIADEAAKALGGADRVRSVKNITLVGYGQYAYMFLRLHPHAI